MRLLENRIILIPEKPLDKIGSIYLPDQSKEEINIGTIVEIGDTVDIKYLHERVIYPRMTGEKMVYEGIDAILLFACEVIAFL